MFSLFKKNHKERLQHVNLEVQEEFVARVCTAADDFLQALPLHERQALDFAPGSVAVLDVVAARVRGGELVLTPMQRVGMATYLYEVSRRLHGGLYEVCDDDDPVVLVVGEPDFDVSMRGISRVEKALSIRMDESLKTFFERFGAAVAARQPAEVE